jgi:hypothetical protein
MPANRVGNDGRFAAARPAHLGLDLLQQTDRAIERYALVLRLPRGGGLGLLEYGERLLLRRRSKDGISPARPQVAVDSMVT